MSFLGSLFGHKEKPAPKADGPFMEHPSGEFDSALAAITVAMERLRAMGPTDKWITFSGQGEGHRPDAYHIEDVPFRGTTFDLHGQAVDLDSVMRAAGLNMAKVGADRDSEGKISLPKATPTELARFLDALFRVHLGIKPFDGENDYAVGAEW